MNEGPAGSPRRALGESEAAWTSSIRPYSIPLTWILVLTAFYAIPFSRIPWSFIDVYENFYKASVLGARQAVVDAFTRGVEYRPFFALGIKVHYRLFGLHLPLYKAVIVLQFVGVLSVFVAVLKPDNVRRAIAAVIAISCVAGLHSSRILFGFFPINQHSIDMLLMLLAAVLALGSYGRRIEWAFGVITLVALLYIEFGLLIPPMLTLLWFVNARGITRRGVIGSWLALGIYAVARLTLSTHTGYPTFHTESGLGFSNYNEVDLREIFANAPWLYWAYNVCANVFSVVFSEPRNGQYVFVQSLLEADTATWQWIHVLSSVATTAFIGVQLGRGNLTGRDRQLGWLGLSLVIGGGGLGYLYARDRIGLPVGLGYGILFYLAAARLIEGTPLPAWRRTTAWLSLIALSAAWLNRDVEAWFILRDRGLEQHLEWTDRYSDLCGVGCPQTDLLERLRAMALSTTPADPRNDPEWTYALFERRFARAEGGH